MKMLLFLFSTLVFTGNLQAQTDSVQVLNRVDITAQRRIQQPDGVLIVPPKELLERATNLFAVLKQLQLPGLFVDELGKKIVFTERTGTVLVRIDGIEATMNDVLQLPPKYIKRLKWKPGPSLRDDDGVAAVLEVTTQKRIDGQGTGIDATMKPIGLEANGQLFVQWNHANRAYTVAYEGSATHNRNSRTDETARYHLTDGSVYTLDRLQTRSLTDVFKHHIDLKYLWADSAKQVFQLKGSLLFTQMPHADGKWNVTDGMEHFERSVRKKGYSRSPVIDVYWQRNLAGNAQLTANVVGTYIASANEVWQTEKTAFNYRASGSTASVITEVLYEQARKPFTWAVGGKLTLKFDKTRYRNDVWQNISRHGETGYFFTRIAGTWGKLSYTAGAGVTYWQYQQKSNSLSRLLFRPTATLKLPLGKTNYLSYTFERSEHVSAYAMTNAVTLQTNSMEWQVGNPQLAMNARVEHILSFSTYLPRITNSFSVLYRLNPKANMDLYTRTPDNRFLFTQTNQPGVNLLAVMNYFSGELVAQKLQVGLSTQFFHMRNRGQNYRHNYSTFMLTGNLTAQLKHVSLSAYVDTGGSFLEGEHLSSQGATVYLLASKRLKNAELKLIWQNPFNAHPVLQRGEVINRYLQKQMVMYDRDMGNAVYVNVSWQLWRGKRAKEVQKTMHNSDVETGILR